MNKISKLISLIVLIFLIQSNSFSKDLDILFKNLLTAENYQDAEIIEQSIWESWNIHPEKQSLTNKLANGTQSMNKNNYGTALELFTEVIKEDPKWAEAWNKRATLLFLIGNYSQSLMDIEKVLDLEPRHFGALDGMGLIFIHQGQYQQAIDVYDKMLEIFPFSLKTMEKKENIKSFISQST